MVAKSKYNASAWKVCTHIWMIGIEMLTCFLSDFDLSPNLTKETAENCTYNFSWLEDMKIGETVVDFKFLA